MHTGSIMSSRDILDDRWVNKTVEWDHARNLQRQLTKLMSRRLAKLGKANVSMHN
jgi:hypothetical protein